VSRGPVLGIDIGGTKLAVGVVDGDGRVSGYLRQSTPLIGDGEELLATIVALAGRMAPSVSACPLAVGVGCGGPMRYPAGIVSPLHIPAWRDFPLRARLERAFGRHCQGKSCDVASGRTEAR